MNPDDIYTLLVEANPAPDDHADPTIAVLDALRRSPIGSETMQLTIDEPTERRTSPGRPPTHYRWMAAAAAALIAVIAIGAIIVARDEPAPTDRADEPLDDPAVEPPLQAPLDEERALAIAADYFDAFSGGDVAAVMALSDHGSINPEANRQLFEMWAVHAERGAAPTVGGCTASDAVAWIEVRCDVTLDDPVHTELGVTDAVFPLRINDDGTVRWLVIEEADFQSVNRAIADYLRDFRPVEYDAVCIPGAYDPGTIVSDANLALTGTCAEVWIPLGDDIAEWIRAGRPEPAG